MAFNKPYDEVVDMLYKNGQVNRCEEICLPCYEKMLSEYGLIKRDGNGQLVRDIAKKGSVVLIRIDGHLTCSIDGVIFDIWDCTDKVTDCYWIIDRRAI